MEHRSSLRFTVEKLKLLRLKKPLIRLSLLEPVKLGWSRSLSINFGESAIHLGMLSTFLSQIEEVYKIASIDLTKFSANK